MAYMSKMKKNLPIYGLKNKDLREFATTEKDRDKGISRMPLNLARIIDEDLIKDEELHNTVNGGITVSGEPLEILENY
jgi:hypothetical protein